MSSGFHKTDYRPMRKYLINGLSLPLSRAIVIMALLVLAPGCEITESDLPPVGSIYVSAYDELGVEVIGA